MSSTEVADLNGKGVKVNPLRRTAFVVGLLFIITFVTSIPAALVLYTPVLDHTDYILGAGADNRIALGAFLEMILIVANIGSAVVLFPILRRQNEALSLGYVTARLLESAFIAVGLLSLLAIVTLRQDVGAAGGDSLVIAGRSLVAIHDWTFLLGPGWVVGVGEWADPRLPDVPIRPRTPAWRC